MLSQNGYDPDTIYTRASDGNGQSALIHVRMSPALNYELQALVQSRAIPQLRTYADVVRDALIHRMHHYREMLGPGASTMFHAVDVEVRQAQLDKVAADREAWGRLVGDLDARLSDLIRAGEVDEARWLIEQNEAVDSMSPAWQDKLTEVLERHRLTLNTVAPRLPLPGYGD